MSPVFASSNSNLRGTRGSHIQYPRPQWPASPLTVQRPMHSPLPFNYSAPKPYRAPSFSPTITHQGLKFSNESILHRSFPFKY